MAALALHVAATVLCPHAGQVSATSTNPRVTVGGQAVVTVSDAFTIAGCVFTLPTVPPKPQPCVRVQWIVPATRVRVGGSPALLRDSTGLCLSAEQIPQGPPNVVLTQLRTKGT